MGGLREWGGGEGAVLDEPQCFSRRPRTNKAMLKSELK